VNPVVPGVFCSGFGSRVFNPFALRSILAARMAADPIIYCLEQVTDYDQFERLCHDLMALSGYSDIEPLGGSKDKGRDAVHVSRHGQPPKATVFAYSVREDWLKKLFEDAEKVKKWNHPCDKLVFLSTAYYTSTERDNAIASVAKDFGFSLELYGIERLRVMLATTHDKVLAKHPQIFCPPFFPQAGGVSLAESRDYLIIDFFGADEALAVWLARRLSLAGFLVWCRALAPVAGSSLNETVESLVRRRAFRYLPILSGQALSNADYTARRAAASVLAKDAVVPLFAESISDIALDSKLKSVEPIRFELGWGKALGQLLDVLASANCPKSSPDPRFVLRSFIPPEVVTLTPEVVISNRFRIRVLPEVLQGFNLDKTLDESLELEASLKWAFRRVNPRRVLAFTEPPTELRQKLAIHSGGGGVWRSLPTIDGIKTDHVVPELVRKSLNVACIAKGLARSDERQTLYFPENFLSSDRLYFGRRDGSRSFVNVAGRRKFWRPTGSSYYRYHLAPVFSVKLMEDDSREFAALARIRVHITDDDGKPLPGRTIASRRKHLCAAWFNDEWLNRTLAIMQWLGTGALITVGSGDQQVAVSTVPDEWQVPVSIHENAIPNARANREDVLARNLAEDEPEGDAISEEAE
jgi:hypothetical protein